MSVAESNLPPPFAPIFLVSPLGGPGAPASCRSLRPSRETVPGAPVQMLWGPATRGSVAPSSLSNGPIRVP
jgi:hypothetical protein